MINLCQILHWKSDEVDTTAADWLQKLTVACDKYKCAPKMSDFFLVKMAEKPPCAIDEFIMSSVIKHRLRLSELSDTVLRILGLRYKRQAMRSFYSCCQLTFLVSQSLCTIRIRY